MTPKPSGSSPAAKWPLLLFSALCLLSLTACTSQQSASQRHQYAIVRYHDSLTDFHEYRPPAREVLAYSARQKFVSASMTV